MAFSDLAHSQLRSLYGLSTGDVTHVTLDTGPLAFQRATLKSWEWPGDEATLPTSWSSSTFCALLTVNSTVFSILHSEFASVSTSMSYVLCIAVFTALCCLIVNH